MPSASANAASITAPPSRTQPPAVGFGWSTGAAAVSRPSVWVTTVRPFASMTAATTGYGPLCRTDAGSVRQRLQARSGAPAATTSGPAVAARVVS